MWTLDGIDDPLLTNARLLLGTKGTISEFEVNLFRQRSTEAILQKTRRGELQIQIPVGFCWAPSGKLEKDPDQHVQQAMQLGFRKMTELGSVRQVLRWFREENLLLPAFPHDLGERKMIWTLPGYASLHSMLTHPIYAGACAYGKTEIQTKIVEARARKSAGHRKPQSGWKVLIKEHHPVRFLGGNFQNFAGLRATAATLFAAGRSSYCPSRVEQQVEGDHARSIATVFEHDKFGRRQECLRFS
jgi:hypothetical protein